MTSSAYSSGLQPTDCLHQPTKGGIEMECRNVDRKTRGGCRWDFDGRNYTGRFQTIGAPAVLLKTNTEGDMTRRTGNLFQYFTPQTEIAPLFCPRWLNICSIL